MNPVTGQPYPYQSAGSAWLASQRFALLADEMGLGKSRQAIDASCQIDARRILVIAPASALGVWEQEFTRWSGRSVARMARLTNTPPDGPVVAVGSYAWATRYVATTTGAGRRWDLLIVDEAHYTKSLISARGRALLGSTGLIHAADRAWFLSGTPMPNHPGELWSLLYACGVTKVTYENWVDKYCTTKMFGTIEQITGAREEMLPDLACRLHRSGFMLRRLQEEVMPELPPIQVNRLPIGPPGKVTFELLELDIGWAGITTDLGVAKLVEKVNAQASTVRHAIQTSGHTTIAAAAMEALAPSVSALRRYTGLQKVEPVVKLLTEELDAFLYQKIVVFCYHRGVIEALRQALRRFKPRVIFGGTDPLRRDRHVRQFQTQPRFRVFIGQITAAGVAISLTAANQVLVVEPSYVPAENAQALKRCHRHGQDRPVFVRFAYLPNTLDQDITAIYMKKANQITQVMDADARLVRGGSPGLAELLEK